jgi:hypothetical protein
MEKEQLHRYNNTPFYVICSSIQNQPGTWDSTKVSIYYDEDYDVISDASHPGRLIGEYIRNYSSFGAMTFHPFRMNNEWYAVYSTHYTATRIMKLHVDRIEDWCGEEPDGAGFCPVEFYVPHYVETEQKYTAGNGETKSFKVFTVDCDVTNPELREEFEGTEYVRDAYCNFGFLCGCHWGDDTSWKIRYMDLSQVPEKILTISEKFGYWQMPPTLTLRECVDMSGWEPTHHWIQLTGSQHINLKTDERC